jgi:hypothetical protein
VSTTDSKKEESRSQGMRRSISLDYYERVLIERQAASERAAESATPGSERDAEGK